GTSQFGWVYLHQGGRYDTTSGLYNFRNRDYSPTLGRWMQVDPMTYRAGDANLYRYAENEPTNATDPVGLKPNKIQVTIVTDDTPWGDSSFLWWTKSGPHFSGVNSPEHLADILERYPDGSIGVLVISGNGSGECGVRASKGFIVQGMNEKTAKRIAKKLSKGA